MKHRHQHRHPIGSMQGQHIGEVRRHGAKHAGAVGIEHAFGAACGPGGVAKRRGRIFIQRRPRIARLRNVHQRLVAMQRNPGRHSSLGHGRSIAKHHYGAQDVQIRGDGSDDRQKGGIAENHAVFGMACDIGNIALAETGIDGVAHRARARNGVIQFQMPGAIHRQRADAVPGVHTQSFQDRHQLSGTQGQRGIADAGCRAVSKARNDFATAVMARSMFQNGGYQQLMTLHQALHAPSSRKAGSIEA